jgi:polyisoprenoid-binding protein YceI
MTQRRPESSFTQDVLAVFNEKGQTMSTLAVPHTSTSTWNIDPAHSAAEFKVKPMMISNVKGHFRQSHRNLDSGLFG